MNKRKGPFFLSCLVQRIILVKLFPKRRVIGVKNFCGSRIVEGDTVGRTLRNLFNEGNTLPQVVGSVRHLLLKQVIEIF